MSNMQPRVGVVVGRFQVDSLHQGHHHLILSAAGSNDKLLIVVGSGRGLATPRYPLPFPLRQQMLKEAYPKATILEHHDHPSDQAWSEGLDQLIAEKFPDHTVTLYGSRDSFLPHYSGRFATIEVAEVPSESGTDRRKKMIAAPPASSDFRSGVIYREATRLPISYQAVDIIITKGGGQFLLLGRKETDGAYWRFIGGFVDPLQDRSLEGAAKREAREEAGDIEIADVRYLGSTQVDDWRYRRADDKVMTALFVGTYIFGHAVAGDDLAEVRWFPAGEVEDLISPTHLPLFKLFQSSVR